MDKAIFLQKQVRENSEDFQNALRDMVAWEEEMKRKDRETGGAGGVQELPPVRNKKKKEASVASEKSDDGKEKRIPSSDYKSWDKFDADKACTKVDGKNHAKDKGESVSEIPSEEELQKKYAEATKYKDEGNALVAKKEYAKAVGKYSQAIKVFPGDAIFYANRALCQLKLDNLYAADADCTQAIKLDEKYVKAYLRRATAREELKRYKDAKKDFKKILELEPSNKEAALKLKQMQEKIDKSSKPITIAGESNEKSSIEETIGKKLFGQKSTDNQKATNKSDKKTPQPSTSKDKLMIEEIDSVSSKNTEKEKNQQDTVGGKKSISKTKTKKLNKGTSDVKKENITDDDLPPWLPKLKEGYSVVKPITEAPRQFTKTLKRIDITEIPDNESIFRGIVEEGLVEEKSIKEIDAAPRNVKNECKHESKTVSNNSSTEEVASVPPPPRTSVAFFMTWRKNESNDIRYKYLKQIEPKHLPSIIRASMEIDVLNGIISILKTKFVPNGDSVYDWLLYLSKLERFRALILFMEPADKEAIKSLLEHCKTQEGKTDDQVNSLYAAYEL